MGSRISIEIVQGDITTQQVDAIVNAGNPTLLEGGGVDGAIRRIAGPKLHDECRRIRRENYPEGLPTGHVVTTTAGLLPARWVIHTVGPNWHRGQRDEAMLAMPFRRAIRLAGQMGARVVALPAISAGSYGWDAKTVARVAISTALEAGNSYDAGVLHTIRFVLFTEEMLAVFRNTLENLQKKD